MKITLTKDTDFAEDRGMSFQCAYIVVKNKGWVYDIRLPTHYEKENELLDYPEYFLYFLRQVPQG